MAEQTQPDQNADPVTGRTRPPTHEETLESQRKQLAARDGGTSAPADYDSMTAAELHQLASDRNIEGRSALTTKDDLVKALKKSDRK